MRIQREQMADTMVTARARYRGLKKAGELTEVSFRAWARSACATSSSYVQWRLGTVYGSFDGQGNTRPVGDLLEAAWNDRKQVMAFLAWRRDMRLRRR